MTAEQPGIAARAAGWVLRLLVLAALVVDAVVHLQRAGLEQQIAPTGIGGGNLFRFEAVVAILAGLYVLVRGSRPAYAVAFVVAGSALAAVLLYVYVQVPTIGPIPSMYEPYWYYAKTLSAVAEGAGAVLALVGLATASVTRAGQTRTTKTTAEQ